MTGLFGQEVRFRLRATVGWSIGMIAFGAVYITVYPQISAQIGGLAQLPIYEALGMNFGGFESYLASVVLNFLPILLGIYAIITGTHTLAGEEDDGTLELLMAQPVSRFEIVTAKLLSIALSVLVITLVAAGADTLIYAAVQRGANATLPPWRLFLTLFSAWPITMAVATISLFLGAFLPRRRAASAIAGLLLIVSYFVKSLSGMVPSLEGIRFLSLFTYFDSTAEVFRRGTRPRDLIVLASIILVFYALALVSFRGRKVMTGAWPWQRLPDEAVRGHAGSQPSR